MGGLVGQKRKHCSTDDDDTPGFVHVDEALGWEVNLSGQETEPDELMEEGTALPGSAAHHLTHASHITNQVCTFKYYCDTYYIYIQSCINVLAWPPKKVKQDPTARTAKSPISTSALKLRSTASNTLSSMERAPSTQLERQIVTPHWCPLDHTPPQAASETSGSTVQERHSKASLPIELQADGKWSRVLMLTLLLWAGGNDNVWSITRPTVAYALPFIVSYDKDLDPSTMDFDCQGPIVSVVCVFSYISHLMLTAMEI